MENSAPTHSTESAAAEPLSLESVSESWSSSSSNQFSVCCQLLIPSIMLDSAKIWEDTLG